MLRALCAGFALSTVAAVAGAALGPVPPILSPAAELGRLAFRDQKLSASGNMSCASCHSPSHAFGPPNTLAVQSGGVNGDQAGTRSVPSLLYIRSTPAFHFDAEGAPTGGFNRDGRADSLASQAAGPLLSPLEMANPSKEFVVERLRSAPYAAAFREAFGSAIFKDAEVAFLALGVALEAYQLQSKEFAPFSSKYDDTLAGRAQLTAAEARGLALFNDEEKGNCAACHPSAPGPKGEPPLFTDFTYDNAGVPRNPKIPATKNPATYDLGLCGPDRRDLATAKDLCGAFKAPSLRNVALRPVFFHNGRFAQLEEAVAFYARRDTHPDEWFGARKFDDLPASLANNVNTREVPYDRKPGEAARLSPAEIADIVAFLKTLTDDPRPR
jgi:cytochrome c peroxidase